MPKLLAAVAVVIGLVFIVCGVIYFLEPASALPGFFPGYQPGDAAHHFKHGIGAVVLGVAAFAFAWFTSKPAKTA